MRKTILLTLLFLSSCASMHAANDCQAKAGPQPYAAANAFGLIGALAANSTDERQTWNKKVDDCMAAWRASNP